MKIKTTTFPNGTTISHNGKVSNIQMIVSDHNFEVQKQLAKQLRQKADKYNKK